MWTLILNAFVRYIESHPTAVDQLVEAAVQALINKLQGK